MARDRVSESLAHLNHPAQSQYAEQPGECVFTTEGSVRTAMRAV
jgi:myosin-crossreactive antigen